MIWGGRGGGSQQISVCPLLGHPPPSHSHMNATNDEQLLDCLKTIVHYVFLILILFFHSITVLTYIYNTTAVFLHSYVGKWTLVLTYASRRNVHGNDFVILSNGNVTAAILLTGYGYAWPADILAVAGVLICLLWAVGIASIIIIQPMATIQL